MEVLEMQGEYSTREVASLAVMENNLEKVQLDASQIQHIHQRTPGELLPKVNALLQSRSLGDGDTIPASTLFKAAKNGDIHAIQRLFEDGVDIRQKNEDGDSALHVAARAGRVLVASILLSHFPVDFSGRGNRTPLHCACAEGHVAVACLLLQNGANGDAKDCEGNFPLLLAVKAGHESVVELLIHHGVSLDAGDNDGNSALVAAAKLEDTHALILLLRKGASLNVYRGYENDPFHIVARHCDYFSVSEMLKVMDEKEQKMKQALIKSDNNALPLLFEMVRPFYFTTEEGKDAMFEMAKAGKERILRTCLSAVKNFNVRLRRRRTCLMVACCYGKTEVVKMLLSSWALVNLDDKDGNTALHLAVKNRHVACVRLLLEACADENVRNNQGLTPLHYVVDEEIRELLINAA